MMVTRRMMLVIHATLLMLAGGAASAATHPDFSGLWQVADPGLIVRPDFSATEADYIPEAWARLQDYRRNWEPNGDDPAKFCVRYGMPFTQAIRARDYLADVQQTSKRVTVLFEYMDSHRVIHFDRGSPPESATESNEGYSIGRWQGDSLMVTTTLLKARSPIGPVQRSDRARIDERWRLRDDPVFGEVLDIDMTIVDPLVFRRPMSARQVYKRAPTDATLNEYACTDAFWDDHVTVRRAEREAIPDSTGRP